MPAPDRPPTFGQTLAIRLADGRLDTAAQVALALRLATLLAPLHARGAVVRNLHPGTIVLDEGEVRLEGVDHLGYADQRPAFGHHQRIVGVLPYLAPEQTGRTGGRVDARADLYALGVVLYELTTGSRPFPDTDALTLLRAILAEEAVPPVQRDPAVPPALSAIVMRLLDKDPDRRYQSADGLAHDLQRLQQALARGERAPFALGERDFALRLRPPMRLVGRDAELATLRAAFDAAAAGRSAAVFISGAPGIGKTALIDTLRPLVTARGGWFISGKFDQYRDDLESDGMNQAFRALGRLLLAEPEALLAPQRERLRAGHGASAGLVAALSPEFGLLLGVAPDLRPAGALDAARMLQTALSTLCTVASPQRPLVMFIDDLQWAGTMALALIDAILGDERLRGVLLVGAYRNAEVDAAHPLTPMLARWQHLQPPPAMLALPGLPPGDLQRLLAEMLRLPMADAGRLAELVGPRTGGNPFDTVEFVNALRREGLLVAGAEGWHWDSEAIRHHGSAEVVDLLQRRLAALPASTHEVMNALALLGGAATPELLSRVTALSAPALQAALAPAQADGVLVLEGVEGEADADAAAVHFRHDRMQQAVYAALGDTRQHALHLQLARRLATVRPALAAEQYLPVATRLDDAAERGLVVGLFRTAAARALAVNPGAAERFLRAALDLASTQDAPAEAEGLAIQHHEALCRLGRHKEADTCFAAIQAHGSQPLVLAPAACAQIASLTDRGRLREALDLGLALLRHLGLDVPEGGQFGPQIERGMAALYAWAAQADVAADLRRPEPADPQALAAARLVNRMLPAAFFSDPAAMTWLVLESQRLWDRHGPCAALVGPFAHILFITSALADDYRTGSLALRHVLAVSQARGYEPDTSQARFLFALGLHWSEPAEEALGQGHRAHEGLVSGGDLPNAGYAYFASCPATLETAPTLGEHLAEVEAALAFARRLGNGYAASAYVNFRQSARALCGLTAAPVRFDEAGFDEAAHAAALAANPTAACNYHAQKALTAALFGDIATLAQHAALAMPLRGYVQATQTMALTHVLHTYALLAQARQAEDGARAALLAQATPLLDWLGRRSAEMPGNFAHLLQWLQAEEAAARGDAVAALRGFDLALLKLQGRQRPWHQALITERAALLAIEQGLEHVGRRLLAEAHRHYTHWGAMAKVRMLERDHPYLRGMAEAPAIGAPALEVSADAIDMLAIVRTSQTLSSETSVARLQARVTELLGALTGASSVRLVSPGQAQADGTPLAASVLQYVERTRAPLVLDDARRDDRFAADPYFAALERCALLVVPVLQQGQLRALLWLENRLARGAFTAERLDAVRLIAGQLAVSLENATLYEGLERRVQERTRELQEAQAELVATARRAGMAQIATNVLHNVGNVLNSVNVSSELVRQRLQQSKGPGLTRAVALLKDHIGDLGHFFTQDPKGRMLPGYLEQLAQALAAEREACTEELGALARSIAHIRAIVDMQQDVAGAPALREPARLADLVDDALRIDAPAFAQDGIVIDQQLGDLPPLPLDKVRLLLILVNLITNARQAMADNGARARRLTITAQLLPDARLCLAVADTGEGVAAENLTRIFAHGFTTRAGGHGFGLHSSALAATEMGGSLQVHSDGPGRGARFTLDLPTT
jgi:predicted ATPase/signal transduction histidine kinase